MVGLLGLQITRLFQTKRKIRIIRDGEEEKEINE